MQSAATSADRQNRLMFVRSFWRCARRYVPSLLFDDNGALNHLLSFCFRSIVYPSSRAFIKPYAFLWESRFFLLFYCVSFWDGVVGSLFQLSLNSVCWSTFQGRSGKVALPKKRSGEKRVFLGDGVVGSFFQFSLNSVCRFTFQKRSGKVARPDRF